MSRSNGFPNKPKVIFSRLEWLTNKQITRITSLNTDINRNQKINSKMEHTQEHVDHPCKH